MVATFNSAIALGGLTSAYLGNPNSNPYGQDGGENFAYLNFYGTEGTTFDQIVFQNPGDATDFEADNFSVLATSVTPPPNSLILDGAVTPAIPEPATIIIWSLLGGCGIGLTWWRKRSA